MADTLMFSCAVSAMRQERYTREVLASAVKSSVSVAGVIRLLGLRQAGGTHSHIGRRIKEFGLDTSHFTGRGSNRGASHRGPAKRPASSILVKRETGKRTTALRLRRALIEVGRDYKCVSCGLGASWNGRLLILQVNHRNRDWLDDSPDNLEFLCPNCHSQTDGWCGSKGGTDITSAAKQARERLKRKRANGGMADAAILEVAARNGRKGSSPFLRTKLVSTRRTKGAWPSDEELALLVMSMPTTEVAKRVGVSGAAVRKRCQRLGIATRPSGYWSGKS